MRRRDFLRVSGMAAAAALLGAGNGALSPNAQAARKPNILFILADDLGWTDVGCYGSSFYDTPNIDRLAAEGVRFTSGYTTCQVCSPTRASIMTGKYPARMDTTNYFGAPQPDSVEVNRKRNHPMLPARYLEHLPEGEVTIADALKEAGYRTFFAGKWHLGPEPGFWPEDHGFDVNKGGHERGGPYGGDKYFSPYGNPRLEDGPDGEHLPIRLANEAAQFIEDNQDNPFLAYLSFYSVHTPLMARDDLLKKYQAKHAEQGLEEIWGEEGERKVRLIQEHAVYAGMVEALDEGVGIVLDQLKALELENDTLVFFFSDNGGLSTSEGHPTSNLPLRGGKGWMYEGGIRVPLIVKWPGVTQAGATCDKPVICADFYPTILEACELPLRPEQHTDGKSFTPLLREEDFERGPIFWHYPHYGNQGGWPSGAVREGDWKFIENYETGEEQLFNLHLDLSEQYNLVETHPERATHLRQLLHRFHQDTDAKMPTPNPDYQEKEG